MSEIEDLLEMVGLLSPTEAAKYLGIGKTKLYAEINSGRLKAKRHQGQTLIPKEALDAWIANLPDHKPADTERAEKMRKMQLRRRIAS
jgi:excisionase family DNA binding protein